MQFGVPSSFLYNPVFIPHVKSEVQQARIMQVGSNALSLNQSEQLSMGFLRSKCLGRSDPKGSNVFFHSALHL